MKQQRQLIVGVVFMFGGVLPAWLSAGCAGEPGTTIHEPPDEVAISFALGDWQANLQGGLIQSAMNLVYDDYLHMGRSKSDFERWAGSLTGTLEPKIQISQVVIRIDGEQAEVDYLLWVQGCEAGSDLPNPPPPNCQTMLRCESSRPGCGWLRYLRKTNHLWGFSGDRASWGHDFSLQAKGGKICLLGSVYDPQRTFTQVTVSWAGLEQAEGGTVTLERLSGDYWRLPDDCLIPNELYPSHPLPWDLDIHLESASGNIDSSRRFSSVMDGFASDLFPNGEVMPPFDFSWVIPEKGEGGVQVEVHSGEEVLWRSPMTYQESMGYSGPNLEEEVPYDYQVWVYDTFGNSSVVDGTLVAISGTLITPQPSGITPQVGSAAGGDSIIVSGEGFLAGARVLFDISECLDTQVVDATRIQCISPPLDSGTYNVLVINPSGRVGLIAGGFQIP